MAKKPLSPEARDRAKDKRLQSKYGITLARRQEMEVEQDHKCKVCGGALDAYGHPCVDHFHFFIDEKRRDPSLVLLDGLKWAGKGYNELRQTVCVRFAKTRAAARAEVKQAMLEWSVRGLLCFKCNYGIGCVERFFDAARHPENLAPVIEYLSVRLKTA